MTAAQLSNLQRLENLEQLVAEQGARIMGQAARIEALERVIAGIGAAFGAGVNVADDADLDDKYGDPLVKRNPTDRFWRGESYIGKHLSECSAEFLDAYAKYKDLCAKLNEQDGDPKKKKFANYDRGDAARARGWAKRLRGGWTPPEKPEAPGFGSSSKGGLGGTGSNPFAKNGGGLGASRSPLPPPSPQAPAPPMAPASSRPLVDDEEDDGTAFPFGANANSSGAAKLESEDDEELPL